MSYPSKKVACPECNNQFDGRMPGHVYGPNWHWVPCRTCGGNGTVDAEPVDLMSVLDEAIDAARTARKDGES